MVEGHRALVREAGSSAQASCECGCRWGEAFGDEVVAAAMIDRLVHHAEVIALRFDGYRLKHRDIGGATPSNTDE